MVGLSGAARFVDHSQDHRLSSVWKVEGDAGIHWLKVHSQARKFEQESEAYALVVPRLRALGHRVPRCLATSVRHRCLLLTEVPGEPASSLPVDDPRWPGIWTQAGRFLRDLHQLDQVPPDPVPLSEALARRAHAWISEAHGKVENALLQRALDAMGDGSLAGDDPRVWAQRDFSPRNWMVDGEGRVGFVDFEHMLPDHWLVDLVKNLDYVWPEQPQGERAFFKGYGRWPDERERRLLWAMRWYMAAGTVAWAVDHGDAVFEAEGRQVLARLAEASSRTDAP